MRPLFRPATLFILLSYLLLSCVPFVPKLLGHPIDRPWHMLNLEAIAWLAVWALFKRPAWFHWLLLPAFLAVPTELYLIVFYGQGISTHHLGIIAETSPREAFEFLGSTIWLLLAIMVAVILWWLLVWRLACRTRALDWRGPTRVLALAALILVAALTGYGDEFGYALTSPISPVASVSNISNVNNVNNVSNASVPASGFGDSSDADEEDADDSDEAEAASTAPRGATGLAWPRLPGWARFTLEFDTFSNSWPFGLMARGVDFYKERNYLSELGEKNRSFSFGARQRQPDTTPEVVILVIGESSRYDRWSVNGYERETNPLLKQETNLITLPDLITPVTATRLSVPVIVSRKPAMQSLKDGFSEKSLLTAYKEAGFKTYWISNQISVGHFDTPVSVFAKEADVVEFLNLGGFTNRSNFDQILFDPLSHALADPAPKKLIVLHTLGSHWNYSQRYPRSFDRWQPSLFGVEQPVYTDTKIKPQMSNSYDSSILYTDWFLAHVIDSLKQSAPLSTLMYLSDHGQTLYDGSCKLAFHGHNTQFEFHIPGLLWYSDHYRQRYPEKVQQLLRHRKARLATENVFDTLLDLGDIDYRTARPEWSFASSRFKQHKRYVDSYGWTNYDNAIVKGDCREVIDRHHPLTQEK